MPRKTRSCRTTAIWLLALSLNASEFVFAQSPDAHGRIELIRDRWGVPHVFAETDAGAFYGLGYAMAEDRAFQMHYNLRIVQGRLAESIGDVRIGVNRARPEGTGSAVQSDRAMRLIGFHRAAGEVAANLDAETRALLEAFSAGINDYIGAHRGELLDLFERIGLEPEPWTPADTLASWWRFANFFAGDGLREMQGYHEARGGEPPARGAARAADARRAGVAVVAGEIPFLAEPRFDDAASVIQRSDVSDDWVERLRAFAREHGLIRAPALDALGAETGPRFSHAWVVGGSRTTTGAPVLISDPQTPVRNPSLLYEFHIKGATFNARGVGVAGSPIVLIGFNETVAWGMTALGADQADLFVLETDAERPNEYQVDGEWRAIETREETIQVKDGRPVNLTFKRSHLGPIVTPLVDARPGDEVALKRIPLVDRDRDTIQGGIAMMRARDIGEFRRALEGWRYPSANVVYGDKSGAIGYIALAAIPIRSPSAIDGGHVAHDGSTSAGDWRAILPYDLLPQMTNPARGYVMSANHRPIASFYPIPIGVSTGAMGDTDRSYRLRELLEARERFTPEDVLATHMDSVNAIKRDIARFGFHLRDAQGGAHLEEETLRCLEYLEGWRAAGEKLDLSIPGAEILTLMPLAFRQNFEAARVYGGGFSGLALMCKTIAARIADDPQAELTRVEAEHVNLLLRAAWRYGVGNYGDDPAEWAERGRAAARATRLPYMDTLDGFPSLDPSRDLTVGRDFITIDGGTPLSQRAQAYTQFVPLHDVDAARTILPIGQSENPASPYYKVNLEAWTRGELHAAPLSRAAVERIADSTRELSRGARGRGIIRR